MTKIKSLSLLLVPATAIAIAVPIVVSSNKQPNNNNINFQKSINVENENIQLNNIRTLNVDNQLDYQNAFQDFRNHGAFSLDKNGLFEVLSIFNKNLQVQLDVNKIISSLPNNKIPYLVEALNQSMLERSFWSGIAGFFKTIGGAIATAVTFGQVPEVVDFTKDSAVQLAKNGLDVLTGVADIAQVVGGVILAPEDGGQALISGIAGLAGSDPDHPGDGVSSLFSK